MSETTLQRPNSTSPNFQPLTEPLSSSGEPGFDTTPNLYCVLILTVLMQ
jgi:hypothetical protein